MLHAIHVSDSQSFVGAAEPLRSSADRVPSLSRLDVAAMLGGFCFCLLISYMFGYKRIFWEDEMLGWMLLRDPSMHHMIDAWKLGADGGGFAFYPTCRAWFWLFGPSETSFRLYSATCFGLAFCVTWITARRFYTVAAAGLGVFGAWFLSPPLVTHLAEGRFYGLLMLATSCAVWFALVKSRNQTKPTVALCVLAFAINGFLTTTHVLGILYSATILAALLVLDFRSACRRPMLYLSIALSWLLLLPERAAILASIQVGKPYFWTTPPNLSRFLGSYCEFSAAVAVLIVSLILLIVLSRVGMGIRWHVFLQDAYAQRNQVLITALILFLLPLALTVQAHFGTSIFINRYLMPLTVPEALLLCELAFVVNWERLCRSMTKRYSRQVAIFGGVLYGMLLVAWIFGHLRHFLIESPDYTQRLTARLPKNVPVLCEDAWVFTELIGRQHDSGVRYTYLLDWPQSISPSAPRLEVTQYHLMENWKKAGYFSGSIEQRDKFLKENQRFLIVHWDVVPPPEGPTIGNPLLAHFSSISGYQVARYDDATRNEPQIWLVCRGTCSQK